MMLGFGSVRALRDRLPGLSCVAAALLVACSVFPDDAVLPAQSGGSVNEGGAPVAEGGAGVGAGGCGGRGAVARSGRAARGWRKGGRGSVRAREPVSPACCRSVARERVAPPA